jgi:hypothetical protein
MRITAAVIERPQVERSGGSLSASPLKALIDPKGNYLKC